jgi:hypothetical protein
VKLGDFELLVDDDDVTSQLTHYFDGDPATATRGTICYAPEGGLAPGRHIAELRVEDPQSGAGFVVWVPLHFEVVADPATPTPATN